MSYLNSCGYKNDVFVSYAHADNEPVLDSKIQWVTNFIDDLGKFLVRKLGRKNDEAPSIWIDHQLALNKPLDKALTKEIAETAIYLIIMSPAYLQSDWCKTEREHFFKILKDKGADTRVFIIEIDEIDRSVYPIDINQYVIPYKFWKKENGLKARTLGFPMRSNDSDYSNKLLDISFDMAKELTSIKESVSLNINTNVSKGNIFLAHVTDDLDEKREEIKRYLKDEGYRVVPEENWYPSYDLVRLQQYAEMNLKDCQLYVQLLSNLPGKKLPGTNESVTKFQFELAKKFGKQILLWRTQGINVGDVTDHSLRLLHESEHIRAGGFEEFKAMVLDAIKPVVSQPSNPSGFVYVCTDSVDRPHCEETIIPRMREKRIDFAMPLKGTNKDAKVVRRFQEQNLLSCDAVVFVYCYSDPDMVLNQIMHCRKVNTERDAPFKIVAIYDGPPTEKDKIDITLQSMNYSYLNCRENGNEFVEKFLNIL
jgi:hypothetical protein